MFVKCFTYISASWSLWKDLEVCILKPISWMNKWRRRVQASCVALNLGNLNQHPNALSPNSCGFHYSSSTPELNVSTYRGTLVKLPKCWKDLWAPRHLSPNPSIRNTLLWINKFLFGDQQDIIGKWACYVWLQVTCNFRQILFFLFFSFLLLWIHFS